MGVTGAGGSNTRNLHPDGPAPGHLEFAVSTLPLPTDSGLSYKLRPGQFSICKHSGFGAGMGALREVAPILA